MKQAWFNYKYHFYILLFLLVVYWPLSLNIFSLKNDALTYFLPYRYNISLAIQNGFFPFWSPYIYTGFPLHADIQSGAWNPVVLLISLFTRYNMTVLQWESLFYLFIGGIGFFKLAQSFQLKEDTGLMIAIAYLSSGFMIDSLSFIPWITSAAYMPFVLIYTLRTLKSPDFLSSLKLALFISLVFLAGYPSYFIFLLFLLFILCSVYLLKHGKNKELILSCIRSFSITALISVVICSPALYSYFQFFPFYYRGSGVSLTEAQINPFRIQDLLSLIFPPSVYKIARGNDISMRNAYFGIIPLLFIFYSLRFKWTNTQKIIAIIALFTFLFTLGASTPIHSIIFKVPLLNTFRHPGTMRIFLIIALLLLSGFGIEHYFRSPENKFLNYLSLIVFVIILIFIIASLISSKNSRIPIPYSINTAKRFLDSSTSFIWIIMAGIVQLMFLSLLYFWKGKKALIWLNVMNMLVMTQLSMGFTTISQLSTKQVNNYIHSFPANFNKFLLTQKISDSSIITLFGYENFYDKRISIQQNIITPTINKDYQVLLNDKIVRDSLSQRPFVFTSSGDPVQITRFSPNEFEFKTRINNSDTLFLTQQYNPNWIAFVNGRKTDIYKSNICFMKIPLGSGFQTIRFQYKLIALNIFMITSILCILFCCFFMIFIKWNR